jgi:hypothetical protein
VLSLEYCAGFIDGEGTKTPYDAHCLRVVRDLAAIQTKGKRRVFAD